MTDLAESVQAIAEDLLPRLLEIGAALRSQDNAATAHPIFLVQQRHRLYGMSADYTEAFEWVHCEGPVADEIEAAQLEDEYQNSLQEPDCWSRLHYYDSWEFVQPFLTRTEAEKYITSNRHNLKDPRVYVDSGYRNDEWQLVRALLMALGPAQK